MTKNNLLTLLSLSILPAHAAVIQFDLQGTGGSGLLGSNENPAVSTTGSGGEFGTGISYDDVTNILSINVAWGSNNGFADLTSTVTASHLHGSANFTSNAGVILGLNRVDSSANNGSINTTVTLLEANEPALLAGLTYINIHTTNNGGGELRGNLVQVPEPSSLILGLLGSLSLMRRRRA